MRLHRHAVLVLMVVTLLCVWGMWLVAGEMAIYLRSERARLEVDKSVVLVNAPVDGLVTDCSLTLGRSVAAGDALVRLDARPFELQAQEKRAEIAGRRASTTSIQHQVEVEEQARQVVAELVSKTARAGKVRVAANQRSFELKKAEGEVMTRLRDQSLASKLEVMRTSGETESMKMQAALAAEQAALDTSSATTSLRDRDVRIAALRKELVDAENDLALQEARLATLEYEVERRTVRAASDGTLADVVPCTAGMTVTSAARLATIVPHGVVRVVAFFRPNESTGRVKSAQPAIVRVENFPWTQYGTLRARVSQVGTEPRDGRVRVELALDAQQQTSIPSIHGLVATVEIETEKISPARLLLRLAGQPWTNDTSGPPAAVTGAPLEAAR